MVIERAGVEYAVDPETGRCWPVIRGGTGIEEVGLGLAAESAAAGFGGAAAAGAGAGAAAAGAGAGLTLSQAAALASIASGVLGAGTSIYGMSQKPGGAPQPGQIDPTALPKALLPTATANAAASAGGGISPSFLSSLVSQQSGTPGAGMGILDDIRKALGQQGA